MSHNPSQSSDKIEVHYRQQLSALVDGQLPADEARFLLRRLQHDEELAGCHERWQLCGDVLRGMAAAPAPADFAARVRQAVAAEPRAPSLPAPGRQGWRWGGGAIAASVALVALFMVRDRMPADTPAPMPVLATTAQLPAKAPDAPDVDADAGAAMAAAAVPAAALASARRQDPARSVASATRSQQAARSAGSRRQPAQEVRNVQVASAVAPTQPIVPAMPVADPFAHPATLQARPWPRSVLAGNGSALNASLDEGSPATFYPFEPRQAMPALETDPAQPPHR